MRVIAWRPGQEDISLKNNQVVLSARGVKLSIQLHVQTETNVNCQNNYVYKQKQMQTVKTMTCTNRNKGKLSKQWHVQTETNVDQWTGYNPLTFSRWPWVVPWPGIASLCGSLAGHPWTPFWPCVAAAAFPVVHEYPSAFSSHQTCHAQNKITSSNFPLPKPIPELHKIMNIQKCVSWLLFWAQSTARGYIRAEYDS